MGWYRDFMEQVGEAIPNEFSKTSSVTKYIPYIGQAMAGIGGLDAYATGYADMRDKGLEPMEAQQAAIPVGLSVGSGRAADPGYYGSPNVNRDVWNVVGQLGNVASAGYGASQGSPGATMDLMNIAENPYFNKGAAKRHEQGLEPKYNFGDRVQGGNIGGLLQMLSGGNQSPQVTYSNIGLM